MWKDQSGCKMGRSPEPYGTILSDRVLAVLEKHKEDKPCLSDVKAFVYDMLEPTPDRGDMLYRYEHSVRVAENGTIIAEAEGLPREELRIACMLHDVGYRECRMFEDFQRHPFISADIANLYLRRIGFEGAMLQEMVRGIALHNLSDQLPEDMTPFQMSVRDSDDIDRFDMIRTAMILGDCTHEKTNAEILRCCEQQIESAKWSLALKRGTRTAEKMIREDCEKRIALLQDLIRQAKKGFEE